jgi:hypothetical protein
MRLLWLRGVMRNPAVQGLRAKVSVRQIRASRMYEAQLLEYEVSPTSSDSCSSDYSWKPVADAEVHRNDLEGRPANALTILATKGVHSYTR